MQPGDFGASDDPLAPADWPGMVTADDKLDEAAQLDDPQDDSQDGTQDDTLGTGAADAGRGRGLGADPVAAEALLAGLVQRIVYQDEAAFAALYRCLAGRVLAQTLRITRDVGCAEEVVEDVFWQVWRQAPRFDPARGCVLAWVRRIARSRALDALRAMGRNPLRMAVELDDQHAALAGSNLDDPAQHLGAAQSAALIDLALAALDPLRRQLVALAFQRGYSQAEIAEQTGLPLGTVKSHIRRALVVMKTSIKTAEGQRLSPSA